MAAKQKSVGRVYAQGQLQMDITFSTQNNSD